MTKNTTTEAPVTVDTLVAEAAKDNLVTPTVPAQAANEETAVKSVDEFDTEGEGDENTEPKFRAVVQDKDGEVHEFDSVGGLLKHVFVGVAKNRKFQAATGAVVAAGAATWALTRKKAAEVIEMSVEQEEHEFDQAARDADNDSDTDA